MSKSGQSASSFYPFCLTKSPEQIRIGKYMLAERWKLILKKFKLAATLPPFYYLPTIALLDFIKKNGKLPSSLSRYCIMLHNSTAIVKNLAHFISVDIALSDSEKFKDVPEDLRCTTKNNIYLEQGANLRNCYMYTADGPIYISKNATIQDGVCLSGPIFIGENSIVKMGATLYGNTIIGSNCLAGGEIKNSVLMNYSNKAHFGYLGDSIIGEWCNLGAGTSNSNVKNNAGDILIESGDQKINAGNKFGMLMGDFSRSAIHTAFNTGTVVGASANVFTNGLTPKKITSFSWGVSGEKYIFEKAIDDIQKWMTFKGEKLTPDKIKKLKTIFENSV